MSNERAIETAWRIHGHLNDLNGKIDSKASFALALESAALGGVAALSGSGHRLGHLVGWPPKVIFWAGVIALGLAALSAIMVVIPRGGDGNRGATPRGYVYYGDLRHWTAEELAVRLNTGDSLPALTRQLVALSQIAWIKHRRVRHSLTLAGVGGVLVALAGLLG